MEEREINIADLLTEILLHWRMFIIWMIAGAVILGVFSYVRSSEVARQQQTQSEATFNVDVEKIFTEEEILNAGYVAEYEKAYREKRNYQEKAPLMQLDPNHVSKAEATVAVAAEDRQRSCDIAKVYKDILESSELIEKVAEDVGMDTLGVSELLYLDRTAETVEMVTNNGGTVSFSISKAWNEESDTFRITTVHSDETVCCKMLDSAVDILLEKQQGLQTALGVHEISIVNESFGVVSDMEVANQQKVILNDLTAMKKGVSDAKEELSDREKQYYDYLMNDVYADTEETAVTVDDSSAGVSVKYMLLGALMAAFVYAFILLLKYIFNTKIRATDSMQELYGLPQLGMIPALAGKKRALGMVDQWIRSIRDHNKRRFTPDEALGLAAVAVKMSAGKESLQEVCLLGCGLKERAFGICEKIKDKLEEEGIHTVILNNVLYDAGMLAELEGAKGAILVESAGSTLYSEIAEELELLKRQGIKILGGILVE